MPPTAAAIKAFVVNRVGDFGFALGIFAIYYVFHDVNFDTVFEAARETPIRPRSWSSATRPTR